MKERILVKSIVGLLIVAVILVSGNTDLIYVAVGALFFVICIAYANGVSGSKEHLWEHSSSDSFHSHYWFIYSSP